MFKRNKIKAEAEAKRLQLEEEYKKAQERKEELERELEERIAKQKAFNKDHELYTIDDLNAGDEGFWVNLGGFRLHPGRVAKVKILTKGTTLNADGSVVKFIDVREEGWNSILRYWETNSMHFCRTEDEVRILTAIYSCDAFKKHIKEETEKLDKEYAEYIDALNNWTWPSSDAPQEETN